VFVTIGDFRPSLIFAVMEARVLVTISDFRPSLIFAVMELTLTELHFKGGLSPYPQILDMDRSD
jgi:hypothetical protein